MRQPAVATYICTLADYVKRCSASSTIGRTALDQTLGEGQRVCEELNHRSAAVELNSIVICVGVFYEPCFCSLPPKFYRLLLFIDTHHSTYTSRNYTVFNKQHLANMHAMSTSLIYLLVVICLGVQRVESRSAFPACVSIACILPLPCSVNHDADQPNHPRFMCICQDPAVSRVVSTLAHTVRP